MSVAKEQKQPQWPTGVLTPKVVEKDIRKNSWLSTLVLSVAAAVLCVIAWPMMMTPDVTPKIVAVCASAVVLLFLAGRAWYRMLRTEHYQIEEDRIVTKQMVSTYDDKDAERLDLPTRTPMLELEKHGSYRIDPAHIHNGYNAYQLYHLLEEGEPVYAVYSKERNTLVRIYLAKYWTVEE